MNLNHICLAVRSVDKAADRICKLFGYSIETKKVHNKQQDVIVLFLSKKGSLDIKLIEPGSNHSNLITFLKKGEGLHHLCFKADDVNDTVDELEKKGARILAPPKPGEAFDDELISFLYAGNGLNVEIIDTNKRRDRLKNTLTDE